MSNSNYIVFLILLFITCAPTSNKKETEGQNKKTVEAYVETIYNKKELDRLDFFFSSQFIRKVNNIDLAVDSSELTANINILFTSFPDLHLHIEYVIAAENKVYMNWTITATNMGNFSDHPATGIKIKISGISRFDFNEYGKIIFENIYYNELSLMQQLGYNLTTPNIQ